MKFWGNRSSRAENLGASKAAFATAGCSLAVGSTITGAVSRRGLKRIMIGSTAESVLQQLPCDMLVVKSPNFAELLAL